MQFISKRLGTQDRARIALLLGNFEELSAQLTKLNAELTSLNSKMDLIISTNVDFIKAARAKEYEEATTKPTNYDLRY